MPKNQQLLRSIALSRTHGTVLAAEAVSGGGPLDVFSPLFFAPKFHPQLRAGRDYEYFSRKIK